jgi:hypothetical protein
MGGGPAGNLFLKIEIAPDPRYRVEAKLSSANMDIDMIWKFWNSVHTSRTNQSAFPGRIGRWPLISRSSM